VADATVRVIRGCGNHVYGGLRWGCRIGCFVAVAKRRNDGAFTITKRRDDGAFAVAKRRDDGTLAFSDTMMRIRPESYRERF
jgi:hypothetical protein